MKQILASLLSLTLLLSLAGCQLEPKTPQYIQDGLEAEEELPVNDKEVETQEIELKLESEEDDDASTEPQDLPQNEAIEVEVESETSAEVE